MSLEEIVNLREFCWRLDFSLTEAWSDDNIDLGDCLWVHNLLEELCNEIKQAESNLVDGVLGY